MSAYVTAGAGFLLAVLWFDLMFDAQALRRRGSAVPDEALASIAAYYARVTTGARPMNRLVAVVMLATIAAVVVEIAAGLDPAWLPWVSLVAIAGPVGLAARRTVPAAVRLGTRRDDVGEQSRLARTILADHLRCFAAVSVLLLLQLGAAAA